VAILATGCPQHRTEVAAPQMYRPPGAQDMWRIEGVLDTDFPDVKRSLRVMINGETAVEGPLPTSESGMSNGTLDGKYHDAKILVDCSSERKTDTWVEIRCRVIVNGEMAVTLVM
jgi:hypothetical protein